MFAVDTNVLVYAANEASPEHERCRQLLAGWRRQELPWYLTWSIVYEFLRIVSHPMIFDRPWSSGAAWGFVAALKASPSLEVLVETERHDEIAARTVSELPDLQGNLMHDAHTAILMREHGIRRIYTRDTDFYRFPFLEVVDPLRV